jgi:hypothetical protein
MIKTLTVCASILSAAAITAFAQAGGGILTFNENGIATLNNAPYPSLGLINDPTGGSPTGKVLAYPLQGLVTPGDVGLLEPNSPTTGELSDLVRFFNPAGGGQSLLLFYSAVDPGDPTTSLADVGIPPAPNAILINETGVEEINTSAIWTPLPGQPGFDTTGIIGTYDIISDQPAPEPGSGALLLGGLGLFAWVSRLRRNAA